MPTPPDDGPVEDGLADDFVQVPLSYPDLEDYPDGLVGGTNSHLIAQNQKAGSKKRKKGPRKTAEMKVPFDRLGGVIFVGAANSHGTKPILVPRGSPVIAHGKISYHDAAGNEVVWKAKRVKFMFRSKTEFGYGPHSFPAPPIGNYSLLVKAEVWSDKRRRWVAKTFDKHTIRVYCPVDVTSLSANTKLLACTIFSEGGSNPKVDRKELVAIAWTVRNRLELLQKTEADVAANPTTANKRKKKYIFSIFGTTSTYSGVLTRARYSGIGSKQFQQCEKPIEKITTNKACARLQLSIDVAKAVMAGTEADPYAGQGNANALGGFYYMTKDIHRTRQKQVQAGTRTRADFHIGKKLAAMNGSRDHHYFWGVNPEQQLPYSDPGYRK